MKILDGTSTPTHLHTQLMKNGVSWITEYSSSLGALQSQGVSRPYLKLLAAMYCNQTGDVNGKTFPIQRGVKQGDVISPLLFNAGLEHVMRKWELRLQHCGFDLGNGEILTNVRYADSFPMSLADRSSSADGIE